jgi:hypothetical protein
MECNNLYQNAFVVKKSEGKMFDLLGDVFEVCHCMEVLFLRVLFASMK